jgi:hypothetical protein
VNVESIPVLVDDGFDVDCEGNGGKIFSFVKMENISVLAKKSLPLLTMCPNRLCHPTFYCLWKIICELSFSILLDAVYFVEQTVSTMEKK